MRFRTAVGIGAIGIGILLAGGSAGAEIEEESVSDNVTEALGQEGDDLDSDEDLFDADEDTFGDAGDEATVTESVRVETVETGPAAVQVAVPAAAEGPARAAESWLALLDSGAYNQSYDAASHYLKTMIPQPQWTDLVQEIRSATGTAVHRNLVRENRPAQLPNAPEGEYAVLLYETDFGAEEEKLEQVTLMKEEDGHWRVAGYYLVPQPQEAQAVQGGA